MQHGAIWCRMVQDGARWCKMVLDGARWCKMVQDGARWCRMVQDGARWFKMLQCSWKPSQEVDHYLLAKQDGVYQIQVPWGASLMCKVNDTVLVIFDDSWNRHTCPKCHNVGLLLSFLWHREFLPTNQLKWAHLDNQLSQTPTHLRGKFSWFENIFLGISKFNLPIYWSWKINNHLSTYRATGAILLEFEAYHLSFHSFTKAPTISNVLHLLSTFF